MPDVRAGWDLSCGPLLGGVEGGSIVEGNASGGTSEGVKMLTLTSGVSPN